MTKIDITDADFQDNVIEQSRKIPVIVDFWASWCGPCMMLGPVLEKVAEDHEGKVVLVKVNVDEYQENARELGVSSIPDVRLFRDGKAVAGFVGAKSESAIMEWLEENIR